MSNKERCSGYSNPCASKACFFKISYLFDFYSVFLIFHAFEKRLAIMEDNTRRFVVFLISAAVMLFLCV
jgi:hypothetical protein